MSAESTMVGDIPIGPKWLVGMREDDDSVGLVFLGWTHTEGEFAERTNDAYHVGCEVIVVFRLEVPTEDLVERLVSGDRLLSHPDAIGLVVTVHLDGQGGPLAEA